MDFCVCHCGYPIYNDAMNLIDYASILLRRGWIMLLLAIIAAASAFVFSRTLDPVYRATQRVRIEPSRSDFGLVQSAKQLLNSQVSYLDSSLRAAEVIDHLQMDMTPQQLRADVRIAPNLDSLVIQIDAEHKDIGQAAQIATEWAQLLIRYRDDQNQRARQEDRIYASLQDNPVIVLARPNVAINTLVGLIAGLFVGGIIVFALELVYIDPPFNSNEDYNSIYRDETGRPLPDQVEAYTDTWILDNDKMRVIRDMPLLLSEHGINGHSAEFLNSWLGSLAQTQPHMAAYLAYMTERLVWIRRMMKPSAGIFLHCDDAASHYLKILMDVLFEPGNFRNEITWKRRQDRHNLATRALGRTTDTIFWYAMSAEHKYRIKYLPYSQQYLDSALQA